jgi:hypothetical protein
MINSKQNIFEDLKNSKEFSDLLSKLSEEERKIVEQSIKTIVDNFEKNILVPLKSLE